MRALAAVLPLLLVASLAPAAPPRKTEVAIRGDAFLLNGRPTYQGRTWKGHRIEGLLLNSRMVQATFNDRNPETQPRWAYPDTGKWDPERNVREFLVHMRTWRDHGLLAVTVNLQGGSPEGYSNEQPWLNSAFEPDGSPRREDFERMGRVIDRADELGMVVILGLFYFGQDERLEDEAAVVRAVDGAVDWVTRQGYRNVLIEVNNECNVRYDHEILKPDRVHELIERVRERSRAGGVPLLVGTSYGGGTVPGENVVRASDFLLLHGNGVSDPDRIAEMVTQARRVPGYRPMPILFNEDDHFHFDRPRNNFVAAVEAYASWGFFDPGALRDGKRLHNYVDGYQTPPVNWGINTATKRGFFGLVRGMTGAVVDGAK
jgi:hypothetical protein